MKINKEDAQNGTWIHLGKVTSNPIGTWGLVTNRHSENELKAIYDQNHNLDRPKAVEVDVYWHEDGYWEFEHKQGMGINRPNSNDIFANRWK